MGNRLISAFLLGILCSPSTGICGGMEAPDTLIYTHQTHEKNYKVGKCETCHEQIMGSRKSRDDNYAEDKSCNLAGCHDIKDQEKCTVCHTNPSGRSPIKPVREVISNHKAHQKKDVECTACHTDIYDRTHFTREAIPDMMSCLPCHQEKKVSNACGYCHTDRDLAQSHSINWDKDHGDDYIQDPVACFQCHTQNHCDRCHSGLEPMAVHKGNYLYIHQFDSFEDQTQCYNCHGGAQYCNDCHNRTWGAITNHTDFIRKTGSCTECH